MADIVLTGDPVCGTVTVQDNDEHCITFVTVYKIIFGLTNPGRVLISIGDNEHYQEYRSNDNLSELTSVVGINKIYVKSSPYLQINSSTDYADAINLRIWGCKNRR